MRKTTQGGRGPSATKSPESCQVETQHVRAALPQFRTGEASLTQGQNPRFHRTGRLSHVPVWCTCVNFWKPISTLGPSSLFWEDGQGSAGDSAGEEAAGSEALLCQESVLTVSLHQGEGLTVPAILQGCRLHVQVAIDAHCLLLGVGAQLAK